MPLLWELFNPLFFLGPLLTLNLNRMKKTVWTFGLISGLIVSVLMLISFLMMSPEDTVNYESGEIIGYASMIIALALIFFAVRSYRNNYQNGQITFGKAFRIGLYVTLIASSCYVITWLIYSGTDSGKQFMDQYFEVSIEKIKNSEASEEEIEAQIETATKFMEYYRSSVLMNIAITFLEIFPVGLLVTLICAAILKRSTPVTE